MGFILNIVFFEMVEEKWKNSILGDFRIFLIVVFNIEIEDFFEFFFLRIMIKFMGVFMDRNV